MQQTFEEHVVGEQFFSCEDDDAALAHVTALLEVHPAVEVWRAQRFVGQVVQPSRPEALTKA